MNTAINETQTDTLKWIVKAGKTDIVEANLDKRTINALARRGFVKVTENKKGTFAVPTAKGKKFVN